MKLHNLPPELRGGTIIKGKDDEPDVMDVMIGLLPIRIMIMNEDDITAIIIDNNKLFVNPTRIWIEDEKLKVNIDKINNEELKPNVAEEQKKRTIIVEKGKEITTKSIRFMADIEALAYPEEMQLMTYCEEINDLEEIYHGKGDNYTVICGIDWYMLIIEHNKSIELADIACHPNRDKVNSRIEMYDCIKKYINDLGISLGKFITLNARETTSYKMIQRMVANGDYQIIGDKINYWNDNKNIVMHRMTLKPLVKIKDNGPTKNDLIEKIINILRLNIKSYSDKDILAWFPKEEKGKERDRITLELEGIEQVRKNLDWASYEEVEKEYNCFLNSVSSKEERIIPMTKAIEIRPLKLSDIAVELKQGISKVGTNGKPSEIFSVIGKSLLRISFNSVTEEVDLVEIDGEQYENPTSLTLIDGKIIVKTKDFFDEFASQIHI